MNRLTLEYRRISHHLNNILTESIDIDSVEPINLNTTDRVEFEYNGNTYGMAVEEITEEYSNFLPEEIYRRSDYKNEKYYNFGFDFDGYTSRNDIKSYKEIAKPLSIIIKSLIEWVKKNTPYFIMIFADGSESGKKLKLYDIVLNREGDRLKSMGYYHKNMISPEIGECIGIIKK